MTTLQQDQAKALDLIITDYGQKKAAYSAVPALVEIFEELTVIKGGIDGHTQLQLKNTTGITETKQQMKVVLGSSAYVIVSGIAAWAEKTKNSIVLAQVNFTEVGLQTINDKLLIPTCKNIYELAEENLPKLTSFGLDAESMEVMKVDMIAYAELLSLPRQQIIDRAAETKQIDVLLRKAFKLLKKQADKLIVRFKKTDLATYNGYMAVRPWPHATGSKKVVPPTLPSVK